MHILSAWFVWKQASEDQIFARFLMIVLRFFFLFSVGRIFQLSGLLSRYGDLANLWFSFLLWLLFPSTSSAFQLKQMLHILCVLFSVVDLSCFRVCFPFIANYFTVQCNYFLPYSSNHLHIINSVFAVLFGIFQNCIPLSYYKNSITICFYLESDIQPFDRKCLKMYCWFGKQICRLHLLYWYYSSVDV